MEEVRWACVDCETDYCDHCALAAKHLDQHVRAAGSHVFVRLNHPHQMDVQALRAWRHVPLHGPGRCTCEYGHVQCDYHAASKTRTK